MAAAPAAATNGRRLLLLLLLRLWYIDGAAMAPLWSSIYPQTTVIASIGGNCPTPHGNNTDRRAAAAAPLTDYAQAHGSDIDGD